MLTVRSFREAIEGLPDDAPVFLTEEYRDDTSGDDIQLTLREVSRGRDCVHVIVTVRPLDDEEDWDDDDDGDDDDNEED